MKKPTNLFKRAAIAVMAASIVAATPTVASAAWETTGKGWNWIVNGQKATGWQWIDSQWYFMDSTGTMKTGWVQEGGSWYYLAPSGAMATGWTMADGTWYYLKSSGAMATGWVNDNGSWYRMNTSGAMITGWTSWNGGWYYMAPGGDMVTGVIKVDGATYAMDATGKMQTGEVTIEGKTYTFGEDGAAVGEAPAATRTFSGAAETTNTGTGTGGTTTPSKPNRPSYGGGGSSTPDPDPGPGPVDPPVEEDREDVAGDQTINAANLADFLTNLDKKNYTGTVTINATGAEFEGTELDLTKLKAAGVVIQSLPDAAETVKLSPDSGDVSVGAACTVSSAAKLPNVAVTAADVTVAAPVGTLTTNSSVAVNGAADTVTVTGDATISGTGSVGAIAAGDNAVTVSVAADRVTAGTGKVTVTADVKEIEAAGSIDVNSGTVETIVSTAESAVTVTVAEGAEVKKVVGDENNITIAGDGKGDLVVTAPAEKPVLDTDYTVTHTDKNNPTEGKIAPKGEAKLQYLNGTTWTDIAAAGKSLPAGTHSIRAAAAGDKEASLPVSVTINGFTGFGTDGYYYTNSAQSKTTGWQEVTGTDAGIYWLVNGKKGGAKTWQVTKDQAADAKHWTYVDENSKASAHVFDATDIDGGELKIIGLAADMRFRKQGATSWTTATAGENVVTEIGIYEVTHAEIAGVEDKIITVKVTLAKAVAPVENTDVSATDADAASPTKGKLTPSGDKTLEFVKKPADTTKATEELVYAPLTKEEAVEPGTYLVRTKGEEGKTIASDPIEVNVSAFTGVSTEDATKDKYFIDSEVATDGWHENITETGGSEAKTFHTASGIVSTSKWLTAKVETKECYVGEDGAIVVTFDPSAIVLSEDGASITVENALDGDAKLYTKNESGEPVEFKAAEATEAGAYEIFAGVTVGESENAEIVLSKTSAKVTIETAP